MLSANNADKVIYCRYVGGCAISFPIVSVDREAVKTLAIAVGVREAARQLGLSEDRVLQWSKRGQWFKQPQPVPQPVTMQKQNGVISVIKSPSDALTEALADDGKATRLGFSKAARKVAEYLPRRSERQLMDKDTAQAAKHWAGVASIAQPGWEQEKKSDAGLVSVALIRLELPANMRDEPAGVDPAERAKVVDAIEVRD